MAKPVPELCYVDTSVLVAAHVLEPHTARAQQLLTAGDLLVVSGWAMVECESALGIKRRRKEIDARQQTAALRDIDAFVTGMATVVHPEPDDFTAARSFCRRTVDGLRAGDALHLAIALRLNARKFATLDQALAAAAAASGIAPADPT